MSGCTPVTMRGFRFIGPHGKEVRSLPGNNTLQKRELWVCAAKALFTPLATTVPAQFSRGSGSPAPSAAFFELFSVNSPMRATKFLD